MVPWEPLLLSLRIVNQLSLIETSQHPKSFSYRLPNEWLILVVDFSHGGAIVLGLLLRDATSEGKPQMEHWMVVELGPQDTTVDQFKIIPGRLGTWKECLKKDDWSQKKRELQGKCGRRSDKNRLQPSFCRMNYQTGIERCLWGVEETSHAYTAWSVNSNHRLRQVAAPLNSLEFLVMFSYSQI
jgi:hypothetical protein